MTAFPRLDQHEQRVVDVYCSYPYCTAATRLPAHTVDEGRKLAADLGWTHHLTYDLCPTHAR